jgi:hypothetical protein
MYGIFLVVALVLGFVAFLVLRRSSSGGGLAPKLLALAGKTPDAAALAALLDPATPKQVRSALDSVVAQLWEEYRREEAVPLIVELHRRAPGSKETRYQVQRLAEVEPQLAVQAFGVETLKQILGIKDEAPHPSRNPLEEDEPVDDGSRELEENEEVDLPEELR